jgi:hypothetical protein
MDSYSHLKLVKAFVLATLKLNKSLKKVCIDVAYDEIITNFC